MDPLPNDVAKGPLKENHRCRLLISGSVKQRDLFMGGQGKGWERRVRRKALFNKKWCCI